MNRISVYVLTFLLCLATPAAYSQGENGRIASTGQSSTGHSDGQVFYHTIEKGQTVYAIATMYGVGVEDIYRLNPGSREGIRSGAKLIIPQPDTVTAPAAPNASDAATGGLSGGPSAAGEYTYHTIQPKETLYSLSVRYAVPATDIVKANPGLSTKTFTIGKTIRIPATRQEMLPVTETVTVQKEMEYTIGKRETMYSLCRKFKISSAELVRLNPALKRGLKAGMKIKIPVKAEETVTREAAAPEESVVNALLSARRDDRRLSTVKVALLLPFMTEEAVPSAATQRFIEYYEGLLLAVDSLRGQGCSIDLSVYDTGSGTKKVKEILKEDALREANLIIGAVQTEQIAPVAAFAQQHGIKYVIPFTSKNDDVLTNASVFQVNTPHSYLYSKAAQAGADLFADYNIVVLETPDKEEKKEFVKAFAAELEERGIPLRRISYHPETFAADIEGVLSTDKRNMVMPTSASPDVLNQIKSPLRMLAETKPEYALTLFGYPEWQTYTRDCLEDFYALDTYIYSNFYADNLSPEVNRFYTLYKNWYSKSLINTYPKYGILGFDTGMFFLEALCRYGMNFEDSLDKMAYKSIQTGFDFHRVNNWGGFINTQLFIVHYKNDFTVTRHQVR